MSEVIMMVNINHKDDHCKYGEDLDKFLDDVIELKNHKGSMKEYFDLCNEKKMHPALGNLDFKSTYDDNSPTRYYLVIDGVAPPASDVVVGNQIWMHTLVSQLISLLSE